MNKPAFQCAVCNQWFETMEAMHEHEQSYHNPQEDSEVSMRSAGGPVNCPDCGAQFETPELMEDHLVTNHGDRREPGVNP
jgi:transcriptional regulator NrdR family protein